MHIEVDQSGKIGDTKVATVLAFSNAGLCAILIPASVKRRCLTSLRERGKSGTVIYLRLFAIGLYLLLKDHVNNLETITIDAEYPGREAEIKLYLLNLFWRAGMPVIPHIIHFKNIGKKSKAHKRALTVFNGVVEPDRVIRFEDILDEF